VALDEKDVFGLEPRGRRKIVVPPVPRGALDGARGADILMTLEMRRPFVRRESPR
jgi:hypothetical protein